MNLRLFPIVFLLPVLLIGCAKLAHLNELLTLKSLADEQKTVSRDVEAGNVHFDMLLAMVQSGDISRYKNKEDIVTHFGAPILRRERTSDSVKIEEWVYRYQTQFFNSPKVYLQFDESQALIKWSATDLKQPSK